MNKVKHFLDLDKIDPKQIREILGLSKSYKQGISSGQDTLKGKTLALIFEKPSTRTRVSFEIAMYQLGGNVSILEHEKTAHLRILQKAIADEITTMVHSKEDLDMAIKVLHKYPVLVALHLHKKVLMFFSSIGFNGD